MMILNIFYISLNLDEEQRGRLKMRKVSSVHSGNGVINPGSLPICKDMSAYVCESSGDERTEKNKFLPKTKQLRAS